MVEIRRFEFSPFCEKFNELTRVPEKVNITENKNLSIWAWALRNRSLEDNISGLITRKGPTHKIFPWHF
jgi:hypothetical protein